MTIDLNSRRGGGRGTWPHAALATLLALAGAGMSWVAVRERAADVSGLGLLGWLGILLLPRAVGVLVPLAWVAIEPGTAIRRRVWTAVRALLGVSGAFALLALGGGHLFALPNRNSLLLGCLLVGLALGTPLAAAWQRTGGPGAHP